MAQVLSHVIAHVSFSIAEMLSLKDQRNEAIGQAVCNLIVGWGRIQKIIIFILLKTALSKTVFMVILAENFSLMWNDKPLNGLRLDELILMDYTRWVSALKIKT